ncbi:1-hydroxy-2-methyl-2-butenyl 4-diphosphate reductase [Streptomyces sp. XD-27]|uniref:phosphorylase family protein n=1 Tax=Streptomyces sp. XD-27 TaxID=3062779 RepID=UPI0026F45159|nr:1-hydroxy-2-methyl-2-butenyl 4-diphosphate reductase [Streptomyces sp. XD-27]WKX73343.1 1-hydroxy-2-methyl-2-butenyl 4-diphosphate reductase [Streptomyces sp. XD-27]
MPAEPASPPGAVPLLIACALGIERLALRGAERPGLPGPVTVLRTGMGPQAAERTVGRALAAAGPAARDTAVIATGFCAGLAPGMHPGDLVVAEETRDEHGRTRCAGSDTLIAALTALSSRSALSRGDAPRALHTGPLVGSGQVVRGARRARLRATGAIAVDMESAATLRTAAAAGVRPVAAVRVVVDAPEHELVRIGTLRGGISAFRVLRTLLPAFFEWHRSLPLPRR